MSVYTDYSFVPTFYEIRRLADGDLPDSDNASSPDLSYSNLIPSYLTKPSDLANPTSLFSGAGASNASDNASASNQMMQMMLGMMGLMMTMMQTLLSPLQSQAAITSPVPLDSAIPIDAPTVESPATTAPDNDAIIARQYQLLGGYNSTLDNLLQLATQQDPDSEEGQQTLLQIAQTWLGMGGDEASLQEYFTLEDQRASGTASSIDDNGTATETGDITAESATDDLAAKASDASIQQLIGAFQGISDASNQVIQQLLSLSATA